MGIGIANKYLDYEEMGGENCGECNIPVPTDRCPRFKSQRCYFHSSLVDYMYTTRQNLRTTFLEVIFSKKKT